MNSLALQAFESFYNRFRKTSLWANMKNTRENSPWHREPNVGDHTQMLIDWYMGNLASQRNDKQRMLTLVACLFHDVAKPVCEVKKHSEERGEYRSYVGHDLASARIWMDFALSENINDLQLSIVDISNIAMMIEYHQAFKISDTRELLILKHAMLKRLGTLGHRAWLDLILSDIHGRIADDLPGDILKGEKWIQNWMELS